MIGFQLEQDSLDPRLAPWCEVAIPARRPEPWPVGIMGLVTPA